MPGRGVGATYAQGGGGPGRAALPGRACWFGFAVHREPTLESVPETTEGRREREAGVVKDYAKSNIPRLGVGAGWEGAVPRGRRPRPRGGKRDPRSSVGASGAAPADGVLRRDGAVAQAHALWGFLRHRLKQGDHRRPRDAAVPAAAREVRREPVVPHLLAA